MKTVRGVPGDFSVAQKKAAVRYIGKDPDRFRAVLEEFFNGPFRQNQRAAGALVDVVRSHPKVVTPYIKRLLVQLDKPGNYPAMTRNILRILQYAEIPENLQGRAVNTGMRIMKDPAELVAPKVFAMTVLANITSAQPDLKNEVQAIIESQFPYGTPAFRSRAKRVLKFLDR